MRTAYRLFPATLLVLLSPLAVLGQAPPTGAESQTPAVKAPPKQQPREPIYDETADARTQIADALAAAKKENRRVLIQWGANWCGWCHLLHDLFAKNAEVRRKLLYEYDVVLIDIGRWDKNLDLAEKFKADFKNNGVPYLTVLDADGKVLANQETGALEAKIDGKPGHDPKRVLEFLTEHQAEYQPAEGRLRYAIMQAREKEKIVFLHFGAPWCGWCHRLEDWLARKDVSEILGKDFIDLKIDVDRTIGGKELMEKFTGGKPSGIPFFVFLAPDNKVLAASWDAQGRNLGCPWAPEEIEAFKGILGKVSRTISEQDVDAITASLGPKEETASTDGH